MFLCFMLVYRAPLHKHKNNNFCPRLRRTKSQPSFLVLLVYRAPLDKHKTLNFGPLQAEKKRAFESFTKGISLFFSAPVAH